MSGPKRARSHVRERASLSQNGAEGDLKAAQSCCPFSIERNAGERAIRDWLVDTLPEWAALPWSSTKTKICPG
jgi:hypothetical protein